jgi:hypothetical protein
MPPDVADAHGRTIGTAMARKLASLLKYKLHYAGRDADSVRKTESWRR